MSIKPFSIRLDATLLIAFILVVLATSACQSKQKRGEDESLTAATTTTSASTIILGVSVENLYLREQPALNASVVAQFASGTVLSFRDSITDFVTATKLNGMEYVEPWLLVAHSSGKTGWVYAGGVNTEAVADADFQAKLQAKRNAAWWGKLIPTIQHFKADLKAISTLGQWIAAYRSAENIKDTLTAYFAEQQAQGSDKPLAALHREIGVLLGQREPKAKNILFFHDYRAWERYAQRTSATEDDAFIQLCFAIFPIDSTESLYPAWVIPNKGIGTCSLLGRGIHQRLLAQMKTALSQSTVLAVEIKRLKKQLLDDIVLNKLYWEATPKLLAELDSLLQADLAPLLGKEDLVQLKTRRRQLAKPKEHGIRVNLFNGE